MPARGGRSFPLRPRLLRGRVVVPPPSVGVADDFNRADAQPPGSAWKGSLGGFRVASNQLHNPVASWDSMYWDAPAAADCEMYFTLAQVGASGEQFYLLARHSLDGPGSYLNGYLCEFVYGGATDTVILYKRIAGVNTSLGTGHASTKWAVGDTIGFTVRGSAISLWRRPSGGSWAELLAFVNTEVAAPGRVGIWSNGVTQRWDDFGGPLVVSFPVTAADTALTLTETLRATNVHRRLTDTGAAIGESLAASRARPRALADTGAAVGDSIAKALVSARAIGDTAFSTTFVPLDSFDRANEDPIAGIWSATPTDGGADGLRLVGNELAGDAGGGMGHTTASHGPDVALRARVAALWEDGTNMQLRARLQDVGTAGYDGYALRAQYLSAGGSDVTFSRYVNGAETTLVAAAPIPGNFQVGDELQLVVSGTGAAVALEAWHKPPPASAPSYNAGGSAGAYSDGTTDFAASWPGSSQEIGDLGVLFVEVRADQTVDTPAGWTPFPNTPVTSGTPTAGTRLYVFYKYADSTAMTGPTVTGGGDHIGGYILNFRGVALASPLDLAYQALAGSTVTSGSVDRTLAGGTTQVANELVVIAYSRATDASGFDTNALTNADLSGLTQRKDSGSATGDGGGVSVYTGTKATPGAFGATVVDVGADGERAGFIFSLRPLAADWTRLLTYQDTHANRVVGAGPVGARFASGTGRLDDLQIAGPPDALARGAAGRTVSDTIAVSDSLARTSFRPRAAADTGATVSDSIAARPHRASLLDTGAAVSDSLKRSPVGRALADAGATVGDSIAAARVFKRALADTGAAVGDSLAPQFHKRRALSDAGSSVSDSLRKAQPRVLADTGAAVGDALATLRRRSLLDTGAAISDSLQGGRGFARALADSATGGAAASYAATVIADGPYAYWRLGEVAGSTAVDEMGVANGTYINTPTPQAFGIPGGGGDKSMGFVQGFGEYATTPINFRDDIFHQTDEDDSEFSLEAWVYFPVAPGGDQGIMGAWNGTTNGGPMLWLSFFTGTYSVTLKTGASDYVNSPDAPLEDTWQHVVATYARLSPGSLGGTMRLYVDGVEVASKSDGSGIGLPTHFELAAYAQGTQTLNGLLDEAAVYKVALTPAQVLEHYQVGIGSGGAGPGIVDTLARSGLSRAASDTGAAITDSVRASSVLRRPSDTGATIADSIAPSRARPRSLADTGAAVTESVQRRVTRVLLEVGASITDSYVAGPRRQLVDNAAAISESVRATQGRPLASTGATIAESIAASRRRVRAFTDTGLTLADGIARQLAAARPVSDQGASVSDSIAATQNAINRSAVDAGAAVSDQLVRSGLGRGLADALSLSDSISRTASHPRASTGTGATVVDSLQGGRSFQRAISDTGAAVSEQLASQRRRSLADAGAAVADSISSSRTRRPTDTGMTVGDSIARVLGRGRAAADTAAAITETLRASGVHRRLADQGAAIADVIGTAGANARPLADVGAAISDLLAPSRLRSVALTDRAAGSPGPASVAGLAGWYDASQLALADGAEVGVWPDLSGANRYLQPVSASAPFYKADGLSGLGVVSFDGIFDALASNAPASYQHIFVVAMYRLPAFTDYDGLVGGLEWLVLTGDGGAAHWYPYEPESTTYHRDGVLAAAPWPAPMNSQFSVLSVSRHAGPWTMTLSVGQDRTIVGRNWDGDVAEVIAYDHVLTALERQQVEGYLRDKWIAPVAPDSIASRPTRAVSDAAASVSDSLRAAPARRATDQGASVSDSLAVSAGRTRAAADAGASVSDSIARAPASRPRALADQGASVTDAISLVANVALTDRAATIADAIATFSGTVLVDGGAVISDSLYAWAKPGSTEGGAVELVLDEARVELVLEDAALAELVYVPEAWLEQDEEPSVGVVILVP